MGVLTLEAVIENGVIRLPASVRLPDHTRVYVVVPDAEAKPTYRVISPRLVQPEPMADFALEVM